jgi:hypothetical protein
VTTFTYYKLKLKLLTEQYGTCTEVSIHAKHVLEKAKKEIAEANRVNKKLTKALEKFKGVEFGDEKLIAEAQGILRTFMQLTGDVREVPDDLDSILLLAQEVKEELDKRTKDEGSHPTVFMRDESGLPMISSHMILGNLKENLKISVNNGDKSIAKSKVAVGEMGALDIKVIEDFLTPSEDVIRDDKGEPKIFERPIRFERMGKTETAIARSEVLPIGTEYECTLRVRTASTLNNLTVLKTMLDLGKNNGLGAWRGSGKKGTYCYQIEEIKGYKEKLPDGWN